MQKRKIHSKLLRKEALECYLFMSPWLVGFVLFIGGPIIASLILSLCKYDILTSPKFVGLGNYLTLFTDDPLFWQSLRVTGLYTMFSIPLLLLISLSAALLLNQKVGGLSWFRTIYYLPSVITGVVVALMWMWMFDGNFGIINYLLSLIGINGPVWLFDKFWVLPAFIVMSLWALGPPMIIFLAGLQGIPRVLEEVAIIDGANKWQVFWNVTIPMLSPVILFNLIIQIVYSSQVFIPAYVITEGGPANSTLFYTLYLYRMGFRWLMMGKASAMAWILFVLILVCTLTIFRSSARWVYYEK